MKEVFGLFRKAIVWDYYRKNALFILAVVLFAFGFLSGREHIAIAKQIVASFKMVFYVAVLWVLYGIKTYLFVLRSLALPEFRFLFLIGQLSSWQRLRVWFVLMFLLNQLTFLYAVFLSVVGFTQDAIFAIIMIVSAQFMVLVIGVLVIEYRVRQSPETKFGLVFQWPFKLKFKLPFLLFYHKYLLNQEPILLLLTKAFSILSLTFFIWLYPTDQYDLRLFGISMVLVAVSHLRICNQWLEFQYTQLSFYQNMPLGVLHKVAYVVLGYLVLLFPEIYFLSTGVYTYFGYYEVVCLLLFLMSLIAFIHFFGYFNFSNPDTKMQFYFFGIVFILLLIMYKIPLVMLSSVLLMSALVIFVRYEKFYEMKL
jgi:hypothetical protein